MTTALRPKIRQVDYALQHTRGPELIRMYHRNITQNHRVRQPGKISMPGLITRAQLIVDQRRFIPTATQKVDA